jgi:hypothetical protein
MPAKRFERYPQDVTESDAFLAPCVSYVLPIA